MFRIYLRRHFIFEYNVSCEKKRKKNEWNLRFCEQEYRQSFFYLLIRWSVDNAFVHCTIRDIRNFSFLISEQSLFVSVVDKFFNQIYQVFVRFHGKKIHLKF